MPKNIWNKKDIKKLKELAPFNTHKETAKQFPDRTVPAVRNKTLRLGIAKDASFTVPKKPKKSTG